jgi:hypothetical protein
MSVMRMMAEKCRSQANTHTCGIARDAQLSRAAESLEE